jgi:hypothetical protein
LGFTIVLALAGTVSGVAAMIFMAGTPGLLLGLSLITSGLALAYIVNR